MSEAEESYSINEIEKLIGNSKTKVPILKKAHVYLTAVVEQMCTSIFEESKRHQKKNASGLYDINRSVLKYSLELNDDFDHFFHMFIMKKFDSDTDYSENFPFSSKYFAKLIEKKGGKDLNLTEKASNLLYYVLTKTIQEYLRVSTELLLYSKKKTVDQRVMRAVTKILFKETKLSEELDKEIVRVYGLVGDEKEDEEGKDGEDEGHVKNDEEEEIIERYIKQLEDKEIYSKPIVTQVAPFDKFWKAEDYHQDYEKRNPNNPYVKNVSIPRLKRFQEKYPELLKDNVH